MWSGTALFTELLDKERGRLCWGAGLPPWEGPQAIVCPKPSTRTQQGAGTPQQRTWWRTASHPAPPTSAAEGAPPPPEARAPRSGGSIQQTRLTRRDAPLLPQPHGHDGPQPGLSSPWKPEAPSLHPTDPTAPRPDPASLRQTVPSDGPGTPWIHPGTSSALRVQVMTVLAHRQPQKLRTTANTTPLSAAGTKY